MAWREVGTGIGIETGIGDEGEREGGRERLVEVKVRIGRRRPCQRQSLSLSPF